MNVKKLQLQDLFIGAWVVEQMEYKQRQSIPMFVSGIFQDGDLYLDFNGNEGDVWEAKIDDIRGIPITSDNLRYFHFVETEHNTFAMNCEGFQVVVYVADHQQYKIVKSSIRHNDGGFQYNDNLIFIHQLQKFVFEATQKPLILEFQ